MLAEVVLGLGQHVVGGIIVAILQERLQHADHVLPLFFGGIDLAQGLAGLDVVGRGLEDLLQLRDCRVFLAGVAVRPGEVQAVAGLGLVGRDGLGQQFDGLVVLALEQGVAALGEKLLGRTGVLASAAGLIRLGLVGGLKRLRHKSAAGRLAMPDVTSGLYTPWTSMLPVSDVPRDRTNY